MQPLVAQRVFLKLEPLKSFYYKIFFSVLSTILIFGNIHGISLNSFLVQYIYFPQSIGSERFADYNYTINQDITSKLDLLI